MNLDTALDLLAGPSNPDLDVAELAFRLAQDEYSDLDVDAYLSELSAMAREAKRYLGGGLESRATGLCRYLFHEMGFHGNLEKYYDPRNSYLNQVMDRRTGIPITLSVLAMAVGERAGMEIVGVGLPGHFIAKAVDGGREVLFDPFHGGRRRQPSECETLVQQVTGAEFKATPESLSALPLRPIVLRMLTNLKAVYLGQQDFPRAIRVMERLRQLAPDDPLQRRDLGISLVHTGQPGRAIDHLTAYLAAARDDTEADVVQAFLNGAFKAVGQWN